MTAHASHIIHPNSRASWRELEVKDREREILEVYERATHALTDRQVAGALRKQDPNYVRPSITRLLQRQVLVARGSVMDPQTARRVRTCEIVPHLVPGFQGELF